MDKYTLILIGNVLALAFFAWLERNEKTSTNPSRKGALQADIDDEDSEVLQKANESYATARMHAGYIGVFSDQEGIMSDDD